MFFMTLSAQVTKEEATEIVTERLSTETRPFTLFAKEDLQAEGYTIETSNTEILELDYPVWIYYVSYTSETKSKYLIVKEENGNLLEINIKNSDDLGDLTSWEKILINLPYEHYYTNPLVCWGNCCWIDFSDLHPDYPYTHYELIIINSYEKMESYYLCEGGSSMPNIDFSKHTLLLARGLTFGNNYCSFPTRFVQFPTNNYVFHITVCTGNYTSIDPWAISIITSKLGEHSAVELNVEEIEP